MKTVTHATITRLAIQHCKGKISNKICQYTHEIVQGSIDEDEAILSVIKRATNWHFYRSNDFLPKKIDSIFKTTSEEILSDRIGTLSKADKSSKKFFNYLGRIIHHIQDMSTPSHVMPIYHGPKFPMELKRGMIEDYFESFMEKHDCRISLDNIPDEISIGGLNDYNNFLDIYKSSAEDMLQNILMINDKVAIEDRPYTKYWQHYTQSEYPKVKGFGEYGKSHKDFINPNKEITDSLFEVQDKIVHHAIVNTCRAILLANKILEK